MKQELSLTIPTDQLALLIQHQVDAVLNTNGLPHPLSPAPTPAEAPSSDPIVKELMPPPSTTAAEPPPVTEDPSLLPPTPAPATPLEPPPPELHSPRHDLSSRSDETNPPPAAGPSDPSPPSGPCDETNCDSSTLDDIPRPDSDATPEELVDFTELLRELEKIDKECRAARRVFEQRIQKHKIIQVTSLLLSSSPTPRTPVRRTYSRSRRIARHRASNSKRARRRHCRRKRRPWPSPRTSSRPRSR
jgi:hypothetical protein